MAVKTFTAGSVLTASDTNTYLANGGLVAVTPTSVTNGSIISGTASATANTTAASITLNGVFSSTYDSYRVVISNLTTSSTATGTIFYAKMHDGTNPASTNYNWALIRLDIVAGVSAVSSGALNVNGVLIGRGTGDKFGTVFDVVNPNLPTHTIFPHLSGVNVSTGYMYSGAGMHQTSSAYTGIQIYGDTGTITGGVFTVYGYRK